MNHESLKTNGHRTAKLRTGVRISLDIILILVLITLYSKNVISLMYHEVVGLVLFILFLLHLIFNRKWIANLIRGKNTRAAKPKTLAVIDVMLVLSWLAVLVTGVMVSKKVFGLQVSSLNPIHFFSAALALIITGVHFGLHWKYFWNFLGKRIRLPRVIAIGLMVIILIFGCWQVVNSSFTRWLSAPFTSHNEEHGNFRPTETSEMPGNSEDFNIQEDNTEAMSSDAAVPAGDSGEQTGAAYGMPGSERGSHGQQPFSILNFLNVVCTYFSIIFLFASVTRGAELLVGKIAGGKRLPDRS